MTPAAGVEQRVSHLIHFIDESIELNGRGHVIPHSLIRGMKRIADRLMDAPPGAEVYT